MPRPQICIAPLAPAPRAGTGRACPLTVSDAGGHRIGDRCADRIDGPDCRHDGVRPCCPACTVAPRRSSSSTDPPLGFNVSLSVAVLFAGVGSVTPPGAATVAVFTNVPVADALTAPVTVNVAVAPTGRSTAVTMLPLPLPAAHVHRRRAHRPGDTTQRRRHRVTHHRRSHRRRTSIPRHHRVRHRSPPAPRQRTVRLGDRQIRRRAQRVAIGRRVVAGVGSVTPPGAATVAVFTNVPVADALTAPVTVNVAVAPTGRSTAVHDRCRCRFRLRTIHRRRAHTSR